MQNFSSSIFERVLSHNLPLDPFLHQAGITHLSWGWQGGTISTAANLLSKGTGWLPAFPAGLNQVIFSGKTLRKRLKTLHIRALLPDCLFFHLPLPASELPHCHC